MKEFLAYLRDLIALDPDHAPELIVYPQDKGFSYTTWGGRATIKLCRLGSAWIVSGSANFVNPDIARRTLRKRNFTTSLEVA